MIFNTSWFFLFFTVFYALLWLMPTAKVRLVFTLISSVVFQYYFAGPAGIQPIIAMAVLTFFFAFWIAKKRGESGKARGIFFCALLVPVLGLLFYKYQHLLVSSLGTVLGGGVGQWLQDHAYQPALPLGISFFTFEFVHYLTDVYHGSGRPKTPSSSGSSASFSPPSSRGPSSGTSPFSPNSRRA